MLKTKKESKAKKVLKHLQKYGSITPKQAYRLYYLMRLAPRIGEWIEQGHNIEMVMQYRNGEKWAKYYYTPQGALF